MAFKFPQDRSLYSLSWYDIGLAIILSQIPCYPLCQSTTASLKALRVCSSDSKSSYARSHAAKTCILKMTGLFNDATVRPIRIYDPQLPLLITAKDALPRL